jgi:hypothetical protein
VKRNVFSEKSQLTASNSVKMMMIIIIIIIIIIINVNMIIRNHLPAKESNESKMVI